MNKINCKQHLATGNRVRINRSRRQWIHVKRFIVCRLDPRPAKKKKNTCEAAGWCVWIKIVSLFPVTLSPSAITRLWIKKRRVFVQIFRSRLAIHKHKCARVLELCTCVMLPSYLWFFFFCSQRTHFSFFKIVRSARRRHRHRRRPATRFSLRNSFSSVSQVKSEMTTSKNQQHRRISFEIWKRTTTLITRLELLWTCFTIFLLRASDVHWVLHFTSQFATKKCFSFSR